MANHAQLLTFSQCRRTASPSVLHFLCLCFSRICKAEGYFILCSEGDRFPTWFTHHTRNANIPFWDTMKQRREWEWEALELPTLSPAPDTPPRHSNRSYQRPEWGIARTTFITAVWKDTFLHTQLCLTNGAVISCLNVRKKNNYCMSWCTRGGKALLFLNSNWDLQKKITMPKATHIQMLTGDSTDKRDESKTLPISFLLGQDTDTVECFTLKF